MGGSDWEEVLDAAEDDLRAAQKPLKDVRSPHAYATTVVRNAVARVKKAKRRRAVLEDPTQLDLRLHDARALQSKLGRLREGIWRAIRLVARAVVAGELDPAREDQREQAVIAAVLRACGVPLPRIAAVLGKGDTPAAADGVKTQARIVLMRLREIVKNMLTRITEDTSDEIAAANPIADNKSLVKAVRAIGVDDGALRHVLREVSYHELLERAQRDAPLFALIQAIWQGSAMMLALLLVAAVPASVPRFVFVHVWFYFVATAWAASVAVRRWRLCFVSERIRGAEAGGPARSAWQFAVAVWAAPGSAVAAMATLLAILGGLDALEYARFAWEGGAVLKEAGVRVAGLGPSGLMLGIDLAAYAVLAITAQACLSPSRHKRRLYFGLSSFCMLACGYWVCALGLPADHEFVVLVEGVWQPTSWIAGLSPTANVASLAISLFGVTGVVSLGIGLLPGTHWRLSAWLLGLAVCLFTLGSSFTPGPPLAPERLAIVVPIGALMVLRLVAWAWPRLRKAWTRSGERRS